MGGPEEEDGDGLKTEDHHGVRRLPLRLRGRKGKLHPGREGFFSSTAKEPSGGQPAAARAARPLWGAPRHLRHGPPQSPGPFRHLPIPRPAVAPDVDSGTRQALRRHPLPRYPAGGDRPESDRLLLKKRRRGSQRSWGFVTSTR